MIDKKLYSKAVKLMKQAKWYHQEDIQGNIIELKVVLDCYFKIIGTDKYIKHRYGNILSIATDLSKVRCKQLLKKNFITLLLNILSNMPYTVK